MKKYQIVEASRDVDYRDAEKTLLLYLKERSMSVGKCHEWARWTYGDVPFWSVWGVVYGSYKISFSFCGIHIYDDGRVVIVSSNGNLNELEKAMK